MSRVASIGWSETYLVVSKLRTWRRLFCRLAETFFCAQLWHSLARVLRGFCAFILLMLRALESAANFVVRFAVSSVALGAVWEPCCLFVKDPPPAAAEVYRSDGASGSRRCGDRQSAAYQGRIRQTFIQKLMDDSL